MKLTRTEAREKIMVILYQLDFYVKEKIEYNLEDVFKENLEIDNTYVRDVVNGVLENIESIDKVISKYLENWDLDRLGKTDKAILRLGAYELIHYDTPKVVVINEAVELAKKYSDDKVVKLINAVLDKIRDNEVIDE
jgi:N utilization substance protein B